MISATIPGKQQEVTRLHSELFGNESANASAELDLSKFSEADGEILKQALQSKTGYKLEKLLRGDWSGFNSQSEAEQALSNILVFWLGRDFQRVDAVFRLSGLYRGKWDERHYADGSTYGEVTIQKAIKTVRETYPERIEKRSQLGGTGSSARKQRKWKQARELFPKKSFPWHIFPPELADSLNQLARSCATSPIALPGAAMAIIAGLVGSTVAVSPKPSWKEPLILWFIDIRPSGSGKTPAVRQLTGVLSKFQKEVNKQYQIEYERWEEENRNRRNNQGRTPPPARPRGYFTTNFTLEGLNKDLSGHGGITLVVDEASAIITGQNQYKSKGGGNDREAMLKLYDGDAARIVRADTSKTMTIDGARIQIIGGIQPDIWKKIFGDTLFLQDGTIFRFLPTIEKDTSQAMTIESWSPENRRQWESLAIKAKEWAEKAAFPFIRKDGEMMDSEGTKVLRLNPEAQDRFLDWANNLNSSKTDLPKEIREYIPKMLGASLRLAGVLHCIERFWKSEEPNLLLSENDILKGVKVAEFYMSHAVSAIESLVSEDAVPDIPVNPKTIHLAQTVRAAVSEFENSRLPVGELLNKFNEDCGPENKIRSPREMGGFVRDCGLEVSGKGSRWRGKTNVYCLIWNEALESFLNIMDSAMDEPDTQAEADSKPASNNLLDMLDVEARRPTGVNPHDSGFVGHDGRDGCPFEENTSQDEDEWEDAE